MEAPQTIGELYDLAHSRKTGEDKKVTLDYAKVSDVLANRIQRELHLDVHGFVHRIDEQYIRHADDGHDAVGEWREDQIPITRSDYEALEHLVNEPDEIAIIGKTRQNLPVLQLKKRVNGHLIILEVFHGGKRSRYLNFLTMYKRRIRPQKGEAS